MISKYSRSKWIWIFCRIQFLHANQISLLTQFLRHIKGRSSYTLFRTVWLIYIEWGGWRFIFPKRNMKGILLKRNLWKMSKELWLSVLSSTTFVYYDYRFCMKKQQLYPTHRGPTARTTTLKSISVIFLYRLSENSSDDRLYLFWMRRTDGKHHQGYYSRSYIRHTVFN